MFRHSGNRLASLIGGGGIFVFELNVKDLIESQEEFFSGVYIILREFFGRPRLIGLQRFQKGFLRKTRRLRWVGGA